jgi:hypothetical protein
MSKNQQIILLVILGITDAYMISHPNLIGKLGVWMYKYEMIKTFPKALITVLSSLAFCYFIANFLENRKGKSWAKYGLIFGLIICLLVLADIFFKFSAGSYAHTGKTFIFGMHLLPIMLCYIFGASLWHWIKSK